MNISTAAQAIRDQVTMDQILALYGYEIKRGGYICCPFHGEKTPSLKVFPGENGWHCFGCGRGGSVIDFVMEHEGCNFTTAVLAIDRALNLGLMDVTENLFTARAHDRVQHALDDFCDAVYMYCDCVISKYRNDLDRMFRRMQELEEKKHMDPRLLTADEWTELASWSENSMYTEYLMDKVEDFKREVASWRRERRRAL